MKRLLNKESRQARLREDKYLGAFIKLFLEPLLALKPPTVDTLDFVSEIIFHASERSIQQYTAIKLFRIPGRLRNTPTTAIQGIGYRRVNPGTVIWVRTDSTESERIDVEVHNGPGHKEQVFLLDRREWVAIKPFLAAKN